MPETKMQQSLTPRIESRDAILIAGSQKHYTAQNLNELESQWESLPFGKIPGQRGKVGYGVVFDGKENECDFEYLAGAEVSTFDGLPMNFARMSVPAQKYAIFPHRDHVSKLRNTIDAAVKTWLRQALANGIAAPPSPGQPWMIEYYGEDFDPKTGMGTMEVWFPVKQ
jgi:AraC family transcriptional regulator